LGSVYLSCMPLPAINSVKVGIGPEKQFTYEIV
jgi:hypothetical protein